MSCCLLKWLPCTQWGEISFKGEFLLTRKIQIESALESSILRASAWQKQLERRPKIQQTKVLVTCQRFGDLFLFGLVWQYFTNQNQYDKGKFKVMATYLQQ